MSTNLDRVFIIIRNDKKQNGLYRFTVNANIVRITSLTRIIVKSYIYMYNEDTNSSK